MPNMDDISYFGSAEYEHRGGIWADAARRERQPTTISEPSDPNTQLPQVQIETGPESLSTTLVSPPPPTQDPNLPSFLVDGNKDQDQENVGDSQQKDDSFEASSPPRSATSAISQIRSVSSSTTKRRSWFMSARDEDSNTESEHSPFRGDDETSRGRPEGPAPDFSSSSRSASSHSETRLASNSSPSEPSSVSKTPPPLPPRRTPPHQPYDLDDTVPPPRSPPSLFGRVGTNASINSNSSATGSFFSTLKARAADKEALKDSAKEAMKKWSANWASLKKGGSDEPAPGTDDGQAKGSSYAEIRRHVEERHRQSTSPGPSIEAQRLASSDRTSPLPHTRRGSRNLSISNNLPTGSFTSNSDSATPSVNQDVPVDQDGAPRDREVETDVTPSPVPAPHPIYTQPSAPKMMMIPGIHASHRGEPQSMGYVAPTPEPAEPKLKAPVIQTVYRLWKNPGSSQATSTSKEPAESSGVGDGDFGTPSSEPSQSDSPIPTSSTSTPPNPKRLMPPPLPPRTAAIRPPETSVTKALPDPAEFGNVSASAALKSIASLDDNSRRHSSSSFEYVENSLQSPQAVATGNS